MLGSIDGDYFIIYIKILVHTVAIQQNTMHACDNNWHSHNSEKHEVVAQQTITTGIKEKFIYVSNNITFLCIV